MKYKTIALIGVSGAGKTELSKDLCKLSPSTFHRVVTNTTREPRVGEIQGVDYNFISEEDFKKKIQDKLLVEHVKFNSNYYGISLDSFLENKINLVVCEPSGIIHLYNHQKVNLTHIINIEREYSLILNSVADENRMRQITQRRINKEEEKELEKIPLAIRNQIINFQNNSSNIRYTSLNFNKIFNMTNIVNLYDYDLKSFISENLRLIKKSFNKTKNHTIKTLLMIISKEGDDLLAALEEGVQKNDIGFMSKINSFMDNLDVLKICHEHRRQASNQLTRAEVLEIHSRRKMLKDFDTIKSFFEDLSKSRVLPEDKILSLNLLKKEIDNLKNSPKYISRKSFRYIENISKELIDYIKVTTRIVTNTVALNSSFIVDAAHIQFEKYRKKHFLIPLDSEKLKFLDNDILYKLFLNDGVKKTLHVLTDDTNFIVSHNQSILFAFPINHRKIELLKMDKIELLSEIKKDANTLKEIPFSKIDKVFLKNLYESDIINDSFNYNLYIKDSSLRKEIENINYSKNITTTSGMQI